MARPSGQLYPKRWPLSYLNRNKFHLHTKGEGSTETDIKTSNRENHNISTALERSITNYGGGGLKQV